MGELCAAQTDVTAITAHYRYSEVSSHWHLVLLILGSDLKLVTSDNDERRPRFAFSLLTLGCASNK
eukprot:6461280-Amphidinium_carterae.3